MLNAIQMEKISMIQSIGCLAYLTSDSMENASNRNESKKYIFLLKIYKMRKEKQ